MKYLRSGTIILFLIPSLFSQSYASTICNPEDSQVIKSTILKYVEKETAVSPGDIKILYEKCASSYASATVHPVKPITDDATIYLRKTGDSWEVLTMGTSFDDEFLATLPEELRS